MPPRQLEYIYRDAGTQTGDQTRETVREKVDSIIGLMRNYRWNIATFLLHFCTAQFPIPGTRAHTPQARTSKLWDAIFHTPALTKILLEHHGELGDLHVKPLLRCIGVEIEALISHRFGSFNPKQTVADLKLNTAIQDLQSQAPMLWRFLCGMVEQRASHDVRTIDSPHLMMICAILTYTRAPRKSTWLQGILSVYLYSMGVKRRCISLLNGFGVTLSYKVLNNFMKDIEEKAKVRQMKVSIVALADIYRMTSRPGRMDTGH